MQRRHLNLTLVFKLLQRTNEHILVYEFQHIPHLFFWAPTLSIWVSTILLLYSSAPLSPPVHHLLCLLSAGPSNPRTTSSSVSLEHRCTAVRLQYLGVPCPHHLHPSSLTVNSCNSGSFSIPLGRTTSPPYTSQVGSLDGECLFMYPDLKDHCVEWCFRPTNCELSMWMIPFY